MPEKPSLDPSPTVDHVPPPEAPATVADAGACQAAGPTGPYLHAPPADAPIVPGYRIAAEIARGGMGRIYAAHDLILDREVAIKTLLPGADADRFVTEAKITARLPHPGIPPVHALGTLADGTPYLAMKLIRGHTLAELLTKRPSPLHELPQFVQVFEQIAQAVGFAHAQGIIHRDLKPLNVMVGAFGEVQVMDWGLAKDVAGGERERLEKPPEDENVTQTAAGAVLGTPSYMAPEQARGEVVDTRADVFALGATLAAILTGQPAFVGADKWEVIDRAARADLAGVWERLTNSGAECELIALSLRCLSAKAAERPVDGRAVAALVAAYRAGVEARLKQAETERAEALVREAEQRKWRRTVQAASGVIAVVLLAGLSASLWQMFRAIDAEGLANQNAQKARDESDAKDLALKDEAKAREQAFAALRSMTADAIERKFTQGAKLTEEDRTFLRGVIAQFDAFAAIKGDDADSRAVRAEGRFRVGDIRYRLSELQESEKDYDEAIAIQKQLAAEFPSRFEFRHNLAHFHNNRGTLLRDTDRLPEAEKDFDQAIHIEKQLAAEFPSRFEFRHNLAKHHNNRGLVLSDTGRLQEAEKEYDQAVSIHKQLVAEFPTRPEFREDLAKHHYNRGCLLHGIGRHQEAEKEYNQALSIQEQLAAEFPNRPEFREELAGSHLNRGKLLSDTGRHKEAEKDYDQALNFYKQLAAEFPSRPTFLEGLAISHNTRGFILYTMGRLKEAERDYDQTLNTYKQLAAEFPSQPKFRQELASSHNARGALLSDAGRLKEAERDYDQALSIQKQLAADSSNQPDRRNDLAGTCVNLAILHLVQRNFVAAKRLLLEARPHHIAALKANPRHSTYHQFYRNNLNALIGVHAWLLEQEDAVRTAELRRNLGWDAPTDAYDAACLLSQCVSIVAKHDKLDNKQRKEAAQFYGNAAMRMLRDAVSKGYKDVAHMKQDAHLDPLRQREDYQKLLAELEGKGK